MFRDNLKFKSRPIKGRQNRKPNKILVALVLLCFVFYSASLNIGSTQAYFNDIETSSSNQWTMGILDFELNPSHLGSVAYNIVYPVSILDNSTMSFNYGATASYSGDVDFCQSLQVDVYLEDLKLYGGPLGSLNFDPQLFEDPANLEFIFEQNQSFEEVKNCNFEIEFKGWQAELSPSMGFTDTEVLSGTATSDNSGGNSPVCGNGQIENGEGCDDGNTDNGDGCSATCQLEDDSQEPDKCMKINEVYYDVDDSHGDDPDDEWIELYNACDDTVDLQNWYLEDNNSSEVINQSHTVASGGFVVIAANAAVWDTYWNIIPQNAVEIALGGNRMFSYGLSNSGDHLILYNPDDEQIDEVGWGSDTDIWDPAVADVAEGHSISRITKGVDTDSPTDWMDTYDGSTPPGPNPGTNPHHADGSFIGSQQQDENQQEEGQDTQSDENSATQNNSQTGDEESNDESDQEENSENNSQEEENANQEGNQNTQGDEEQPADSQDESQQDTANGSENGSQEEENANQEESQADENQQEKNQDSQSDENSATQNNSQTGDEENNNESDQEESSENNSQEEENANQEESQADENQQEENNNESDGEQNPDLGGDISNDEQNQTDGNQDAVEEEIITDAETESE